MSTELDSFRSHLEVVATSQQSVFAVSSLLYDFQRLMQLPKFPNKIYHLVRKVASEVYFPEYDGFNPFEHLKNKKLIEDTTVFELSLQDGVYNIDKVYAMSEKLSEAKI
jgi:hypothetical protein